MPHPEGTRRHKTVQQDWFAKTLPPFPVTRTIVHRTGDITIDTCFDADRMDLPRVGITPLPDKMATKKGAQLVGIPDYADFYAKFKKGEV